MTLVASILGKAKEVRWGHLASLGEAKTPSNAFLHSWTECVAVLIENIIVYGQQPINAA